MPMDAGFPLVIDPLDYWTPERRQHFGPFVYNSKLYAVGRFRIYKSTDGHTWATISATGGGLQYSVALGVNKLYVLKYHASGPVWKWYFATFNLDTESWEPDSSDGPDGTNVGPVSQAFYRADGSLVAVTTKGNGFGFGDPTSVTVTSWTPGGGWSAMLTVEDAVAGLDPTICTACMDVNSRVHIFWAMSSGNNALYHKSFTSANVLTASTIVESNLGGSGIWPPDLTGIPAYKTSTDEVLIPLITNAAAGLPNVRARLYRGTPASNPVWTAGPILSNVYVPDYYAWAWAQVVLNGDDEYFFWLTNPGFITTPNQLVYNLNGGVETLIYDSSTWSEPTAVFSISITRIVGVRFGMLMGMEYLGGCVTAYGEWTPLGGVVTVLHTTDALLAAALIAVPAEGIDCISLTASTVGEVFDLRADFSRWLEAGDTITSAAWTAPAGIGLSAPSTTATTASVRISTVVAEAGREYILRVLFTTQLGLTEVKSIMLAVRSCAAGEAEPGPYLQPERLLS